MININDGHSSNAPDEFFGGDILMANCVCVLALAKRDGIFSLTDSEIARKALSEQSCRRDVSLKGCDIIETSQALRRLIKGNWVIHGNYGRSYSLHPSVDIKIDNTRAPLRVWWGPQILEGMKL